MARRSHNETFILLRNNAQKNRSFYKDFNKDDERVKLVSANDAEENDVYDLEISNYSDKSSNGMLSGYRENSAYPSWISSLDEFRYDAFNIKDKLEQLKKIQEEHLKQQNTAIFADEVINERLKNYELDIDRRCQELNVLFNRLHSILTHFQTLKGSYSKSPGSNRMISAILRNIFQFQVQEIVNLTQLFRSCQRIYVERRNEATRIDPEFVITFDEDLLNEEINKDVRLMEDSVLFEESPQSSSSNTVNVRLQRQTQLQMDDQMKLDMDINAQMQERQHEMNSIMKSFAELNQIFQEVNALVVDQGSALDRIDYNIEQVEHRVELGAVSLEKAHQSIKRMRKLKIILGASLLLFIIFLLIVIRS